MDLDEDGVSVDPDENGTADRGEHGGSSWKVADTNSEGPFTGAASTAAPTLSAGCDSQTTTLSSPVMMTTRSTSRNFGTSSMTASHSGVPRAFSMLVASSKPRTATPS